MPLSPPLDLPRTSNNRFGRKSLLVVGAIGTTICLSGVAWVFYSNSHQSALLALLVSFIAFFALS
ncbi:MAG: MFS transporter, partial [Terracidiphilus sp.]